MEGSTKILVNMYTKVRRFFYNQFLGKYENAREVQNDGGNFLVDSLDEEDKSIPPSTK